MHTSVPSSKIDFHSLSLSHRETLLRLIQALAKSEAKCAQLETQLQKKQSSQDTQKKLKKALIQLKTLQHYVHVLHNERAFWFSQHFLPSSTEPLPPFSPPSNAFFKENDGSSPFLANEQKGSTTKATSTSTSTSTCTSLSVPPTTFPSNPSVSSSSSFYTNPSKIKKQSKPSEPLLNLDSTKPSPMDIPCSNSLHAFTSIPPSSSSSTPCSTSEDIPLSPRVIEDRLKEQRQHQHPLYPQENEIPMFLKRENERLQTLFSTTASTYQLSPSSLPFCIPPPPPPPNTTTTITTHTSSPSEPLAAQPPNRKAHLNIHSTPLAYSAETPSPPPSSSIVSSFHDPTNIETYLCKAQTSHFLSPLPHSAFSFSTTFDSNPVDAPSTKESLNVKKGKKVTHETTTTTTHLSQPTTPNSTLSIFAKFKKNSPMPPLTSWDNGPWNPSHPYLNSNATQTTSTFLTMLDSELRLDESLMKEDPINENNEEDTDLDEVTALLNSSFGW